VRLRKSVFFEFPFRSCHRRNDSHLFCCTEEYPEFVEKTRAMSRIYSQRNRDKLKRQIEELEAWKAQLEREQDELLETRKNYKRRLADTEEENEALRRKLIEHAEHDVRLLEQRNLVQRQQLQEELLLSNGSSLLGQGVPTGTMGSGGMLRGVDIGIRGGAGSRHEAVLPPVYGRMDPPARWSPQHFAATSPPSVARMFPQYYPQNIFRPSPARVLGTSLPDATGMSYQSQIQPQLPVFYGQTGTMAALYQQPTRSRGMSLDCTIHEEKGQPPTSRSPKTSKKKRTKK
jgi:hypothetical protein